MGAVGNQKVAKTEMHRTAIADTQKTQTVAWAQEQRQLATDDM